MNLARSRCFVGADQAGRLLEVGVVVHGGIKYIIHAMPAPAEPGEVMEIPRSRQWILDHADELAKRIEEYEFKPEDERDLAEYLLRRAAIAQAQNERDFTYAVGKAREDGWSWRRIGEELGCPPRRCSSGTDDLPSGRTAGRCCCDHPLQGATAPAARRIRRGMARRIRLADAPGAGLPIEGPARSPDTRSDRCGRRIRYVVTPRSRTLGPASRPVALPPDGDDASANRASGRVVVPQHVRWSDPQLTYDLGDRADRIRVYEQVMREGTEDDVRRFVDVPTLVDLWDDLVLPPAVRAAWATWLESRLGPVLP